MNRDEQIEILEAYRDGKTIELKVRIGWLTLGEAGVAGVAHEFDFRAHEYRIVKTGEERLIDDLEVIKSFNNFTSYAEGVDRVLLALREGKYRDE